MASPREVAEGLQEVGEGESPSFAVTTTNTGSTPSSITVTALLEEDWSDITATVYPTNSPSPSGDVITLSPFIPTSTYRDKYIRINVAFTVDGNPLVHYIRTVIRR